MINLSDVTRDHPFWWLVERLQYLWKISVFGCSVSAKGKMHCQFSFNRNKKPIHKNYSWIIKLPRNYELIRISLTQFVAVERLHFFEQPSFILNNYFSPKLWIFSKKLINPTKHTNSFKTFASKNSLGNLNHPPYTLSVINMIFHRTQKVKIYWLCVTNPMSNKLNTNYRHIKSYALKNIQTCNPNDETR